MYCSVGLKCNKVLIGILAQTMSIQTKNAHSCHSVCSLQA